MDSRASPGAAVPPAVILPVKGLANVKERLASLLSADERRVLVLAMLEDVSRVVHEAKLPCWVLSPDAAALDEAEVLGARPLEQHPTARSLNDALTAALARPEVADAGRALVLLPDVPLVKRAEILTLAHGCAPEVEGREVPIPRVCIAPDRARLGTNALSLPLPAPIRMRFGSGSLAQHHDEAARRGAVASVLHFTGLALDLDTPDDVRAFMAVDSQTVTRQALDRIGVMDRL
jgi:2-phospho-L-lactate guanylyltransferase